MGIAIYLRKSRADEEAERTLGQGETLRKHRQTLLKFAKDKSLDIIEIKEEIVSGDSLFHRPRMLELLKEVEEKKYTGVLVMDIDRLGRGGMKDQGIILEAFKESNTKIITPLKTYDLNNEFDEEMTEFKTFFSRRELKTINRRMQGGRTRSVEEGNYIATNAPLGYNITYIQKNRILEVNEFEANIVKLIFNMYLEGNGAGLIANHLNSLGYKTKSNNNFEPSGILFILKNLTYTGKITWKKKEIKKSTVISKINDTRTRDRDEWVIAEGKHKAIIENNIFEAVQKKLKDKYHVPYQLKNGPANPLAGLIICGVCKNKMVLKKYAKADAQIMCNKGCGNKSSKFKYVEAELLIALEDYLSIGKTTIKENTETNTLSLHLTQKDNLLKKLDTLNNQKGKLFDLLEQGIYTNEVFLNRSNNLNKRISEVETEIYNIDIVIDENSQQKNTEIYEDIKNALELYPKATITEKNQLLKKVITKATYTKSKEQCGDDFELLITPKFYIK